MKRPMILLTGAALVALSSFTSLGDGGQPSITGVDESQGVLAVRCAGIDRRCQLSMAYGAADAGDNPLDWDSIVDIGILRAGATGWRMPIPEGWGSSVKAARFFLTEITGATLTGDTRLQYLETPGLEGQAVETPFVASGNTRVEIKFQPLTRNVNSAIVCSRSDSSANVTNSFTLFAFNDGNWRFDYGTVGAHDVVYQNETPVTVRLDAEGLTVDGVLKKEYERKTFDSKLAMTLFGAYSANGLTGIRGAFSSEGKSRIWSVKVWGDDRDENSLALDLVPCKDKDGFVFLKNLIDGAPFACRSAAVKLTEGPVDVKPEDVEVLSRSRPVVPLERKRFSSLDYVTDRLIAQWDAIENAGRGLHLAAPGGWTELVGGAAALGSQYLVYDEAGVKFEGANNQFFTCTVPGLAAALADKACTVEMQLRPTGVVTNGGYFMAGSMLSRGLLLSQRSLGTAAGCAFGGLEYAATKWISEDVAVLPKNDYFGKDVMVTVTVDGEGAHVAYDGGENVHTNPGAGMVPTLDDFTVGKFAENNNAKNRMEVRSIRVYAKTLTREESQWNLAVDRMRFGLLAPEVAFTRSDETGKTSVSIGCPDLPFEYGLYAVVRKLDGTGDTCVTNELDAAVEPGPAVYDLPGIVPEEAYEVSIRLRRTAGGETHEQDLKVVELSPAAIESPDDIYQTAPDAAIDNPDHWILSTSSFRRAPKPGDRVFIGVRPGDYRLRLSGPGCRLEDLDRFGGVNATGVTARVELLDGARISATNGFNLGATGAGMRTKASLLISGGTLDVGGAKFSMTGSDGSGEDSSASVLIRDGGELCLDRVYPDATFIKYVASLQLTGMEPVDFTVSTGGVLRANYKKDHKFCACGETFTGSESGGVNASFTVDGGSVIATNTIFYSHGARFRMKGGSWYAKEIGITRSTARGGRMTMTGGDVRLADALSLQCSPDGGFDLLGGRMDVARLSCQAGACRVLVSGGMLKAASLDFKYDEKTKGGRAWFGILGSDADVTVDAVQGPPPGETLTTSAFWDYRFDSTARPGGPGVAPRKKTADDTTVHGHYRISPYGGFQLVSTNVFPLVVHTAGRELVQGRETNGMMLGNTCHTDLWDYALTGPTFVATLKEDAALVNGRTYAEGRVRGYLQLPRVGNPKRCPGATVRMNVVPQGTNTLAGIVDVIAKQYPGAAATGKDGYNVEIPLPIERLGRGEMNKVVFDFSDVTSFANARDGVVTTNAVVTAIAAKVKRPGLVLILRGSGK